MSERQALLSKFSKSAHQRLGVVSVFKKLNHEFEIEKIEKSEKPRNFIQADRRKFATCLDLLLIFKFTFFRPLIY